MITTVMSYLQYASSSLGSPVDCVPVLLVVVLLLVAALTVQLLLLLMLQPAVRRQRAVPALLGFELLLIKNVNKPIQDGGDADAPLCPNEVG